MAKKLIITKLKSNIISALYDDFTMLEANITNENVLSLNDIYIGRVENILKNISSAFVEIRKDVKCFYSLDDNKNHIFLNKKDSNIVRMGDLLLVQISKEGMKTKLPSLSCNIQLPGKYTVLVKDSSEIMISNKITDQTRCEQLKTLLSDCIGDSALPSYGFIVRTNAEHAKDQLIFKEALNLKQEYKLIFEKARIGKAFSKIRTSIPSYISDINNIKTAELEAVITDSKLLHSEIKLYFEQHFSEDINKIKLHEDKLMPLSKLYNIEGSIQNALNKKVWLKSGGYLVIEPTEALTVIDVNTGKFSGSKKEKEDTFLKINLEAAEEIGKQLRLRNLSGIIIVDFISLTNYTYKKELIEYFGKILSQDPVPATLVGMTKLDLVEITRKKIRKPLYEMYRELSNGGFV